MARHSKKIWVYLKKIAHDNDTGLRHQLITLDIIIQNKAVGRLCSSPRKQVSTTSFNMPFEYLGLGSTIKLLANSQIKTKQS